MIILAHRGFWRTPDERNTVPAFERAFAGGFGVETDVRDRDGRLVIAHDPPVGEGHVGLDELVDLYLAYGSPGALALNIKADGLQAGIGRALERVAGEKAFVFDMAVPDALGYVRAGLAAYTRQSEYEGEPAFYEAARGVWMDSFKRDWITAADIASHLDAGKQVALVSPELHRRPHEAAWQAWKPLAGRAGLMVCTDFPDRAAAEFA